MDLKMIENTESDGPCEAIHSEHATLGMNARLFFPRTSMGSIGQREGEPKNEIEPQFYILPFGIKPALLMLTAFVVGAAVVGASINEGMRGHVVGTSVLVNSTDSLWEEYPSVSTSCLGAIQKCRVKCYHEELECYKNGKEKCDGLVKLCLGTDTGRTDESSGFKPSCLALQQRCEKTALCFQGHQFCHVGKCFDNFITKGSTSFKRAARMVWTDKAMKYDTCVHPAATQKQQGPYNLKGVTIQQRSTPSSTADGCSDDMEACLITPYLAKGRSATETDILGKLSKTTAFEPTNYREKSCESQEALCRATCHKEGSSIDQLNLVAEHIELTPLKCETQCAEIGKICAAFEKCSADYQQCEAATCAPKVGGPYIFDKTAATWGFTDPDAKEFLKCKDGCLRGLESCFQSVGPACKPDAKSQYCELPA
jgi:hypothetical protein